MFRYIKNWTALAVLTLILSLCGCGKQAEPDPVVVQPPVLPSVSVIQSLPSQTDSALSVEAGKEPETPKDEPEPEFETETETEVQKEAVTLYNCGPIQIAIPNKYLSQLVVETNQNGRNGYQPLMNVYEKASMDAAKADFGDSGGYGFLFGFGAVEAEDLQDYLDLDIPGRTLFAQDGSRYYVYAVPTDFRFYRSGGESETELDAWDTLNSLGPQIREDIINRCGLSPYSGSTAIQLPSQLPADAGTAPIDRVECIVCGNTGVCIDCFDGSCMYCSGSGQDRCTECTNGRCNACLGSGFHYQYVVGGSPAQVPCSQCRGGICRTCGGTGYTACRYCFNGRCMTCGGSGKCYACGGASIFW